MIEARGTRRVSTTAFGVAVVLLFGGVPSRIETDSYSTSESALHWTGVVSAQVGGCSSSPGVQVAFFGQTRSATSVVWCLDRSGSMAPDLPDLKDAVVQSLQQLVPQQTFGLVAFETATSVFNPVLVPATPSNVTAAIAWVQALQALGVSCMADAAVTGINMLNTSPHLIRRLFVVSDGVPNCPAGPETLLQIAAVNIQQIPIDTFGLGGGASGSGAMFLQELADQNNGLFFAIP